MEHHTRSRQRQITQKRYKIELYLRTNRKSCDLSNGAIFNDLERPSTPTPSFKVTPFFDAEYLRNSTTYKHSFNEIVIGTYKLHTPYSTVSFRMTLSGLAKYSMTRSVERSLCDSWPSCRFRFYILHSGLLFRVAAAKIQNDISTLPLSFQGHTHRCINKISVIPLFDVKYLWNDITTIVKTEYYAEYYVVCNALRTLVNTLKDLTSVHKHQLWHDADGGLHI